MEKHVRVYKFALRPPTENADMVIEQLTLAARYQNKLVELERKRRAELRLVMSAHGNLAELEEAAKMAAARCEALEDDIKAAKKRREPVSIEMMRERDAARLARRDTAKTFGEARAAYRKDLELKAKLKEVDAAALIEQKAARAQCGVLWTTYLLPEAAMAAAAKQPLYDGVKPNDPRFQRFTGDGAVSVLIPNGQPVAWLEEPNRWIYFAPAADGPDRRIPGSKRSQKRRVLLRMRIQSDASAKPIFASWPCLLHRPLPPGARVKRAIVTLTAHGPRTGDWAKHIEWYLHLTLESDTPFERPGPDSEVGMWGENSRVAIDLGWRQMPEGGFRIGTAWDGGATWFLPLDAPSSLGTVTQIASGLVKADELRGTRDRLFNEVRDELVKASEGWGQDGVPSAPEWWPNHLRLWTSPERLYRLIERMENAPTHGQRAFGGGVMTFDVSIPRPWSGELLERLRAWKLQDEHLWAWEAGQRLKTLRRRKDYYRCIARGLADRYQMLMLEQIDLQATIRIREVPGEGQHAAARSNQFIVAPGELREALVNAFGPRRVFYVAGGTTHTCHVCKHLNTWSREELRINILTPPCANCGHVEDQDVNAAKNIFDGLVVEAKDVAARTAKWVAAKAAKKGAGA